MVCQCYSTWYFEIVTETTPDQPKRAVKYRRISDDREGLELAATRQDEDLDALAEREGVVIVGDYLDNDISASTKSRKLRPAYSRMLADAKAGKFEYILAYTSSRLTRRIRENEDLIELGEHYGIKFKFVRSPDYDLYDTDGRVIARILASINAGESERISERVQRKHRQLAQQGKDNGGGTRPFGYEKDRKTVREPEAKLIRDATRRILEGDASLSGLVSEWNEKDIPTVTGARWSKVTLRRMLMSARISGRREHNGAITNNKAQWGSIISHEDSDRLRELLRDPARRTNHTDGARRYLLSGFLFCGVPGCGLRMISRPQGDHQPSYVCAVPGRSHLRIKAEPLELFVKEMALLYLDRFVTSFAEAQEQNQTSEAELWRRKGVLRRDLEEADDDYRIRKIMDRQRYERQVAQLQSQIDDVDREITRVQGQTAISNLPTNSAHARSLWERRGLEWRRQLIKTLVVRVTVGPGVRGLNKFDDRRVSIAYRQPDQTPDMTSSVLR